MVGEEVSQLNEHEVLSDSLHHPSVSAFFSGQKAELMTIKDILEKRGSVVTTQYGGMARLI